MSTVTASKPRKIDVHTVCSKSGRWYNKMAGQIISGHYKQDVAIEHGRKYARKEKTMHRVHDRKGVIVTVTNHTK